jgi:hypothetical protein
MINNILATDMGLHFKYMSDLGSLQQKVAHDKGVIDGWSVKVQEEQKDLTCGLLIKCADICNVVSLARLSCAISQPDFASRHVNLRLLPNGPIFSQTNSATKALWSKSCRCHRVYSADPLFEKTSSNLANLRSVS